MANDVKDVLLKNGVSPEQAELIAEAIQKSRDKARRVMFETSALRTVRRSLFSGSGAGSRDFRDFQALVVKELKTLTPTELASATFRTTVVSSSPRSAGSCTRAPKSATWIDTRTRTRRSS